MLVTVEDPRKAYSASRASITDTLDATSSVVTIAFLSYVS
jgi:hypothetical protein